MTLFLGAKVRESRLYILEKRQDSLYLIIKTTGTSDTKEEYYIKDITVSVQDSYLLNWSYFVDKSTISIGGACLVSIDKLKNKDTNSAYCLPGKYANRALGRVFKNERVIAFDSTNFDLHGSLKPYWIVLYNLDLTHKLARLKIENDTIVVEQFTKEPIPPQLVFNEFNMVDATIDFSSCIIKLLDLHTMKTKYVDKVDFTAKKNEANCYFAFTLEWINEREFSYVTCNSTDGFYRKIVVWKYDIVKDKLKSYTYKIGSILKTEKRTSTDKFKVHVYKKDFLFIEDHSIYLNPNTSRQVLYETNESGIIIDAMIVRNW